MKKHIFSIALLVFLSSCSIDWHNENKASQSPQTSLQNTTKSIDPSDKENCQLKIERKEIGSGFTLSQTDDETLISYRGKVIKTWSHTPPEKVPFMWDEACEKVWKGFDILPPDKQNSGKQGIWDALTEKEKRDCMREFYGKSLGIGATPDPRFITLDQGAYEGVKKNLFDLEKQKIYPEQIPEKVVGITYYHNMIIVHVRYSRDTSDELLIFTEDFELKKTWKETRSLTTLIESITPVGDLLRLSLKTIDGKTSKENTETLTLPL